jgi:stage IV sporulation protein B
VRKRKLSQLAVFLVLSVLLAAQARAAEPPLPPLIPVGTAVGLKLHADGAVIIGLNSVGDKSPASDAGLRDGDVITHLGAEKIDSVDECKQIITDSCGEPLTVRVKRNGKELQFSVTPIVNKDGTAELGVWLRDGIAGIGTITFIEPKSGVFGALGHSISDGSSGALVPLKDGSIMPANVSSIIKGESGVPGQLQGSFDPLKTLGSLTQNTEHGVFGMMSEKSAAVHEAIPTAKRGEIICGPASILSNISGTEVREYAIEVTRVYPADGERDMLITITDPELLSATGGIVQGMSGSPILQNGKLIGAVTHVLVSDPKKGYAISIERMLNEIRR